MSKNFNRSKASKYETNKEIKYKVILYSNPWDDCCYYDVYPAKMRMYRTWKHNRKTQWK